MNAQAIGNRQSAIGAERAEETSSTPIPRSVIRGGSSLRTSSRLPFPLSRVPHSVYCLLPIASCLLLTACGTNQRTLSITSEPTGALVYVNDVQLGETPLEAEFLWFGVYDIRVSKLGFEPLITTAEANPRLHDQPGFDFFSEVLPGTRETIIRWHFTLPPEDNDQPALLERARQARESMNRPADEPDAQD
jgi:hypothetical protein